MNVPPEQEAIRARCFNASGRFVEFSKDDVETSIPERFEKMVRVHHDQIAVKIHDRALTYDELNKSANRVAWAIVDRLGTQNRPVVIFSQQDLTAIVLCFAIWKSGKIVIAVEPSFPIEQILSTINEAQAEALLTTNQNLGLASAVASKAIIPVINFESLAVEAPDEDLVLRIPSETPAEIRYSSGSTGKPKGIVRNHRRLLSSARSTINLAHICPDDRLIALTRLRFGTRDLLICLLSGAALFPFDIEKDSWGNLVRLLDLEKITCYKSVPTIFRYLVGQLDETVTFPFMRLIQLGGDLLYKSDIASYKKYFSDQCILINRLSAGETGNLCVFFIDKNTEIDTAIVPVGYPIQGKKVFVLDESHNEVEVNQIGEIAVASRYLSSGYWNNPELTNDKFLRSKESNDERLYISGDLGRILPDGCLVYMGRKDHQVKIRGAKVEIGEIEAVLSEHPQIKQSVVLAFDRSGGDKYLTAYIVRRSQPAPTVTDINDFLRNRIPDYMIPSAFVFLESLPLSNGKVDRNALPKPDDKRPELSTSYALPRNEMEQSLVQIWEEVLDVRPIGIHDKFFDLGGHSLSATRVVSRVVERFQLEIPLQSLFESPTISDMAAVITEHREKTLAENELAAILDEVESLSDEEVQYRVSKNNSTNSSK
jgi:amino acid adenylation domain-containing protein